MENGVLSGERQRSADLLPGPQYRCLHLQSGDCQLMSDTAILVAKDEVESASGRKAWLRIVAAEFHIFTDENERVWLRPRQQHFQREQTGHEDEKSHNKVPGYAPVRCFEWGHRFLQ